MFLGEEVQALDYHEGKDSYVIGINHSTDFKLSEDDFHNDSVIEGKSQIQSPQNKYLRCST